METIFLMYMFQSQYTFKSYYVVWKLPGAICIACSMICLNRTMQYGNPHTPGSLGSPEDV